MQALATLEADRLKGQLQALQAWIRDLTVENAALRRRLLDYEAADGNEDIRPLGPRCSGPGMSAGPR